MSTCCSTFIGLGSNLNDPPVQLEAALAGLERRHVDACCLSSLYRTEPWGGPDQPWFFNRVAGVRFEGDPWALLRICQAIETEQGRVREAVENGPRIIDLDLLLFGDRMLDSPALTLPHPRLAERRFVLVPLREIAPEVEDPRTGLTIRALLDHCLDESRVEKVEA